MNINDICKLKYYGPEPECDDVIVSCSIFRIQSMYRDMHVYINGLLSLIKFMQEENQTRKVNKFFTFVYYDHSVSQDAGFIKILEQIKSYEKIKICEYHCPSFIDPDNNLHRGIFGMFIRSLPMYEERYSKNLKTVQDIDLTRVNHLYFIRENVKRALASNCKIIVLVRISYGLRYCGYFNNQYLEDTAKYQIYLKNMYAPMDLMVTFLKMLMNEGENSKVKKVLDDLIHSKTHENRTRCENTLPIDRYVDYKDLFVYGIDEYYENKILLPYLFEKAGKYGVIYSTDYFPDYVEEMIDYEKSDQNTLMELFKAILGNRFDTSKDLNELKKRLSQVLLTPVINNNGDYYRYLSLLKKFYYMLKDGDESKKLVINLDWLKRLRKHVNHKLIVSEYMRGKYLNSNALKVILDNYQVYEYDVK